MKKIITLAVVISAFVAQSFAQNVEWEEKNFPDKKSFKEAKRHYESGNDYFNEAQAMWIKASDAFSKELGYLPNGIGEMSGEGLKTGGELFRLALDEYLVANQFNPNSASLNFKIAVCYYNISSQKLMGLSYAEKAVKLNPSVDGLVNYYLGRLYHLSSRWDEAITAYRSYQQTLNTDPSKNKLKIEDMNRKIAECINGKEFSKNPERVFIDNLGSTVNSPDPEYTPIITADESTMLFTSCRSTTTGGTKDDDRWAEDLYKTEYVNGKWTTPVNMGKPVNSEEHDATAGVSPDGQRLYVYRATNNGDLYESLLKGNVWTEPERMNKNINSDGHESTVSLSGDGKKLYFISDKKEEGAVGHRDIWYSTMDEKGKWGKSTNMGPAINTRYGEEGVFVHADGKTIYFSSQGHKSMGGYDIFKIVFENGKWSDPINLGYPINGPDDDVFFVISASGKHGYYASNKGDGMGEKDIYKITFLGPEKPLAFSNEDNLLAGRTQPVKQVQAQQTVPVQTAQVTILKGTITDINTKKPLGATIEIVDNSRNEVVASMTANTATGKYLAVLPSGKNYGIAVKMDGYLFHSENFDIPAGANYQEVVKDVEMKPIVVGSTIVLKNVFFDYNKATLKSESFIELDRVVKLLNENPTMRIELSGHTDALGTETYNQKLSEDRAKSCVDYLISKGIKADRLEYKGYGETKPIDTNETEPGRANNRRTEFKIIGK
jgi:outer membrane protein OmpA-like peptidoglycan-associated protein/tetratricopeptide (TPR) repeat protein